MPADTFNRALKLTLGFEGGYANDPDDRGGATNFGVTQETYDAWRGRKHLAPRPVKQIEDWEVRAIYRGYWEAASCDELPDRVAIAQFDAAVNHGPRNAAKLLQRAVGVADDGVIGSKTRAAVKARPATEVLNEMLWVRVRFYFDISTGSQLKFLRGWLLRVLHLRKELLAP